MSSSIGMYAGSSDLARLLEFCNAIGLHCVPLQVDLEILPPADGPICYLSVEPLSNLHPYGTPKVRISYSIDPLLIFQRPYFSENHLVFGFVQWPTDAPELAKLTKPFFGQIRDWLRKNWQRRGSIYFGPEAQSLADSGAECVNGLPEGLEVRVVRIGESGA